MNDRKNRSEIAVILDRHKATISREISRNGDLRGYRPKQANFLTENRSHESHNDRDFIPEIMKQAMALSYWNGAQNRLREAPPAATSQLIAMFMRTKPVAPLSSTRCVIKEMLRMARLWA